MDLQQLEAEKKALETYLDLYNVRTDKRDQAIKKLAEINSIIEQAARAS